MRNLIITILVIVLAAAGVYIGYIYLADETKTNITRDKTCHGDIVVKVHSSYGVFSQDEKDAYVIVNPHYKRPATGICAFPNGGIPLTVHDSLDLIKINLATGNVEKLDSILKDDLIPNSFEVSFSGRPISTNYKDDNNVYISVSGVKKSDFTLYDIYLKADLIKGTLEQLSSQEEYDEIVKNMPIIRSSIDKDGNGNQLRFDDDLKSPAYRLYGRGAPKTIIEGYDWLPYDFKIFNSTYYK